MKDRVLGSMMAVAAVVAFVLLLPVLAVGQAPAASRWNPPRLPDGRPDIQGLWIADTVGVPAHSVEDGNDPDDYVILGRTGEQNPRVIIEPADGRIPYQPAAAAKRTELQWEDSRHEGERDAENILRGGRRDKAAGLTGIHEHRRDR